MCNEIILSVTEQYVVCRGGGEQAASSHIRLVAVAANGMYDTYKSTRIRIKIVIY